MSRPNLQNIRHEWIPAPATDPLITDADALFDMLMGLTRSQQAKREKTTEEHDGDALERLKRSV